ncbi:MAG: hypothetical protein A2097_03965 [Desulfobacula sp. GWF2_41_7]|nr:MAG: hypothetical protein A2097_03965 [Desulfobacula sp. GWF2_41_7]
MKDKQTISCDLLIIGAGFAGMVAAARASSLGLKTVQVGNSSTLFLVSGLFDLLGVYPITSGQSLHSPATGLERLRIDNSRHPYSKTGYIKILESLNFLKFFLAAAGLDYQSNNNENYLVLTAAGTFKPSFMVPKTFIKGCGIKQGSKRLLLIDFNGLREFSAKQIANVIQDAGSDVSVLTIEIPAVSSTLNPIQLANLFEDIQFLKFLSKKISPFSKKTDLVGFPAVCGLNKSLETIGKLEEMTGLDCFEIPGMPPSLPGLRLKNAFEKQLSQNNVIFLNNSKIESHEFKNHQFILNAVTQNMNTQITTKGVILASGRFPGCGLHAKRELITETVFNLPVFQPETRNKWYHLNFFNPEGHAINQAGLETDDAFRPVAQNNAPAFKTLYAVGSILAHNDWVRLKSGSGVSCVTAYSAVNDFYNSVSGRDTNV